MIRQQAAESLISQELLSQAAQKQGIMATNPEIVDQIRKTPEFQQNGQFQSDLYFRLLEANKLSPNDFENRIRKQVAQNRALQLFQMVTTPNKIELEKIKDLKKTKWNVSFVKVEGDKAASQISVSEAEAMKALQNPEFATRAENEFKANQNMYQQKEEVSAQHILIAFKAGDAASEAKALEKITALKARSAKEDFGTLASQASEDPGSKGKKGDLGYFGRGSMVKEFEDVAFSAAPGSISAPVKTAYGYHLIKVKDHRKSESPSFDQVKMKVAQGLLKKEMLDQKLKSISEALKKGDESTVNQDVKALGLNWEETGEFDMNSEFIPKLEGDGLAQAVYSLNEKQKWSPDLVRSSGNKYILKLKDIKTAAVEDKAKEDDAVKQRRAQEMLEAWVDHFRKASKVQMNTTILN